MFDVLLIICMLVAVILVCLNKEKVQLTHKGQETIESSKNETKFFKVISICLRPFIDEELLNQFPK